MVVQFNAELFFLPFGGSIITVHSINNDIIVCLLFSQVLKHHVRATLLNYPAQSDSKSVTSCPALLMAGGSKSCTITHSLMNKKAKINCNSNTIILGQWPIKNHKGVWMGNWTPIVPTNSTMQFSLPQN